MKNADDRRPGNVRTPRFQLIGGHDGSTRWRLLGSNNVSLGLGVVDYRDSTECATAIQWLCRNLSRTRMDLTHLNGIQWRWVLHSGSGPIATATRPYGRKIEAKRGYERFVAAVGIAAESGSDGRILDWRAKYRLDSPP
ncbi:DUF1508 domain-containing protein [Amycolatopsis endophytica]|uniref:DUF1508 domain-containing protein n=1 Tax=Amycolatopsis endophytica TaxID=860233 RepID=A0A853B5P1_9PSEU|nr:DUF1508 domain-containing protein [Amycolatopsis endophytica]NYI90122.1 hypothetical protein [Amycolatopsis endophytica]